MSGSDIGRVGVVRTGVIGASWKTVTVQWPAMEATGLAPGASPSRLHFTTLLRLLGLKREAGGLP